MRRRLSSSRVGVAKAQPWAKTGVRFPGPAKRQSDSSAGGWQFIYPASWLDRARPWAKAARESLLFPPAGQDRCPDPITNGGCSRSLAHVAPVLPAGCGLGDTLMRIHTDLSLFLDRAALGPISKFASNGEKWPKQAGAGVCRNLYSVSLQLRTKAPVLFAAH